jgi:hypothetical protein
MPGHETDAKIEPHTSRLMTWQVIAAGCGGIDTAAIASDPYCHMSRTLLLVTLVLFGALSAAALWQHGYWGLFQPLLASLGGAQVLADLVIALLLVMGWMWHDAKASERNVWPWIVFTLAAGSFGPLLYLLTRKRP